MDDLLLCLLRISRWARTAGKGSRCALLPACGKETHMRFAAPSQAVVLASIMPAALPAGCTAAWSCRSRFAATLSLFHQNRCPAGTGPQHGQAGQPGAGVGAPKCHPLWPRGKGVRDHCGGNRPAGTCRRDLPPCRAADALVACILLECNLHLQQDG